jgi:hypothetical protein
MSSLSIDLRFIFLRRLGTRYAGCDFVWTVSIYPTIHELQKHHVERSVGFILALDAARRKCKLNHSHQKSDLKFSGSNDVLTLSFRSLLLV